MCKDDPEVVEERLEYLRGELRAERISWRSYQPPQL